MMRKMSKLDMLLMILKRYQWLLHENLFKWGAWAEESRLVLRESVEYSKPEKGSGNILFLKAL